MGNAVFIVWRESIEAMLVIGILHGWLRGRPEARAGLPWLWGGVAAGLGLAVLLALVITGIGAWAAPATLEWFQAAMPLVACGLVFQMVWWMRRRGAGLKKELEAGMQRSAIGAHWLGIATLAAVAVGREGAETVVFLYGALQGAADADFVLGGGLGFLLALAVYWLLSRGTRFVSWRAFFRVTEILLLLLGGALLVDGAEKLVGMEVLPPLADPLWNTSTLLDDSMRVGGFVAAFTGYRAMPSGMAYALLAAYWALALGLLPKTQPRRQQA
ncbi:MULTISPECIES: FTR1 family iron permease [Rhodanobacter]|uniref:FTR1 family iron permease n=1 Tax=Rhodanobacter TaxID=75309 RepID=UPI0003FF06B6|nr:MULTISPECIES: FTR1 family protein [Rhodanobacter]TAN16006.1 MAG: FTR1 family iron permease [Rhodanobacter sp.]UJJ54667.1 FTR1 family protein [Rhodanobacter thiooxydans]